MQKKWKILQPDIKAARNLAKALHCHSLLAILLINRNITSESDAVRFLRKSIHDLNAPFLIKDMESGVRRLAKAIITKENILIFGDYDVDGVTAVTILYEFLHYAGANVSYYIPHRINEGYGLRTAHITDYAQPNNISLVVTVDCGSGSLNAVQIAKQAGIDVVITDHHNISGRLPEADAVINPCREDCKAGFQHLAGVGVTFCFLICLRKHLRDRNFWNSHPEPNLKKMFDLVALGTVADMVPMVDENRIFIHHGMEEMNTGERAGLAALMEVSGIRGPELNVDDIGFRLAPRLNAAGRLDHASKAVTLLTATDMKTARETALDLNSMNKARQDTEAGIYDAITGFLEKRPDILERNSFVLAHDHWHEGVLGIIASKLVRRYFRPVILISTKDGTGKGSARSIPGFDLFKGLQACKEDLLDFGGHTLAAGLKIDPQLIDHFRNNFENTVNSATSPDDFLPTITIDAELEFDTITEGLTNAVETMQPFGNGNPEPIFMSGDVQVVSSRIVGKNHRQMMLKQYSGKVFRAIHFNINPAEPVKERFDRIAFHLQWNRWNGSKTIQLLIVDAE